MRLAERQSKKNVFVNHVLVVQADAGPHHSLAGTFRIPRNSQLRGEVFVRLTNRIAEAGKRVVNRSNRAKVPIRTACVTLPAQSWRNGEIRTNLPGVADIERHTVIRS